MTNDNFQARFTLDIRAMLNVYETVALVELAYFRSWAGAGHCGRVQDGYIRGIILDWQKSDGSLESLRLISQKEQPMGCFCQRK